MAQVPLKIDRRVLLLIGASVATLASSLAARPAQAQSTLSGILGARAAAPKAPVLGPTTGPIRSTTMMRALSRQRATLSRTEQIRSYVLSARTAAMAATRPVVADGLSAQGLDPTDVIGQAVAAATAGDTVRANELLVSASASLDSTGLKTWEGAGLPTQTTVDGKPVVTINQSKERALLSWNRFDVGANTTVQFNQNAGWVAVNRVTNATHPTQILGNVKSGGTVVVLNRAGIIFGAKSQVNTHSLIASTLDLGNATVIGRLDPTSPLTTLAATVKDRNNYYFENGLFAPANGTAGASGDTRGAALLVSGIVTGSGAGIQFADTLEGGIVVDNGARLATGTGGFLILAAPLIENSGSLAAIDGQVSLQAGRAVSFLPSTGAATEPDPDVRGYKLNSYDYGGSDNPAPRPPVPGDGRIVNYGLIESRRGYLSLGTGAFGSVEHDGLLSTTTSVSRNAKISVTAGTIQFGGSLDLAMASGIEMLPDENGETIPQGTANEPAGFKTSKLEIGTQVQILGAAVGGLVPTNFAMGTNAVIYAPGANVSIGATTIDPELVPGFIDAFPGRIDIGRDAIVDVAGLKDVQLDASRNQIAITPVKRNELRDTPNYREVALDGEFTLNGATLYVDPRLSGVRDDGVAWIGSPLIEAGSLASQIGVTAQEFMTKAGTVDLATSMPIDFTGFTLANAPLVRVDRNAVIDFSGGWVTYAAGSIRTSRLITSDGRVVDIGQASPNDVYVGVADGFTEIQPRFGILQTAINGALTSQRFEAAYDEGRDAGRLTISSAAVANDSDFLGNAFAGARQVADGDRPTLASTIAGDPRLTQRTPYELPSGGAVSITSMGDVLVYDGSRGPAESNFGELLLWDNMLSDAGLSSLALTTSGAVTFAGANPVTFQQPDALTITGASDLLLAPGGALSVVAGRTIRFDGTVTASSGTITARTQLEGAQLGVLRPDLPNGSAFRVGVYGAGGDDVSFLYAADPGALNPFDIVVTGNLSTAGLWINDSLEPGGRRGGAFPDGGAISLTVAPSVFAAIGSDITTATQAADLSGSIRLTGTLNVASGGYVTPVGGLVLDGVGGDVSLINATVYASTRLTQSGVLLGDGNGTSDSPLGGASQSVDFTPLPGGPTFRPVLPNLVPVPRSTVDIAAGTIRGFGFAGGGTLAIVAPDVSFGSDVRAGSTHIGLEIFETTGFGTLNVSSYRSRIVDDIFTNARSGLSAFLETTRFVVGAGETFDLTQWVMPTILDGDQSRVLRGLATGADVMAQPLLAPIRPDLVFDQRAANLVLGGLTELDVLAGGQIVGAPAASLTVSKLYNAGEITLRGGTITQRNDLPNSLIVGGLGVRDAALGGNGLADAFGGGIDEFGRFDEQADNAAGILDPVSGGLLSNAGLVSREGVDRLVYFLGLADAGQGLVFADGSNTFLAGIALLDPRAPFKADGSQIRQGTILDGGSIRTQPGQTINRLVTSIAQGGLTTSFSSSRTLIRDEAAAMHIGGTSATFDQPTGFGDFVAYPEWSAAGTISALGGGSLANTPINAYGGAPRAQGGTLEWLNPTIGSGDGTATDYLSKFFIEGSGFDSVLARGSLLFDGQFSLTLDKALLVTSQDPTIGTDLLNRDATVSIGATPGTVATINAAYIRLASRLGSTALNTAPAGDAAITFVAQSQGVDIVGGIGFDPSISALWFQTRGDVRLIGVNDASPGALPVYNGQLVVGGDLAIDARRTYATTGTGNLQALIEGEAEARTRAFDIAALGDHSITFGNTFLDPAATAPLSAGTHLRVLAARIAQNGYLAAPLGLLELGGITAQSLGSSGAVSTPTQSVTFGAGSVTTVSGAGLNVPYGTTSDLIEYFFPTISTPITGLPTGQLTLAADVIDEAAGALIDGRGGGDVFAYEFQSGIGGSRDVLDRINRDPFSSNGYDATTGIGYQYPDQRQVFALVPVAQAGGIAPFDPLNSADYGSAGPVDLYGARAGQSVTLEAAPNIPAGEYLLVPAKYALSIPGALRLVENSGFEPPLPGQFTQLLDGSIVVGGTFAIAGTGIGESTRRSFTLQTRDTILAASRIVTTSGSQSITDSAAAQGLARPRLPLDAARVVLSPLSALRIAGAFDTSAATGGQGGQFDILGSAIAIRALAEAGEPTAGVLTLTADTLTQLGATSLLIGGRRADMIDGSTTITPSASTIDVGAGVALAVPELLLAAGGFGSTLTIDDSARLTASGVLGTQPTGDYLVAGAGSLVRLSSGAERLVTRVGSGDSTIRIGAASLTAASLAFDTSGSFAIADAADIAATRIAISGGAIRFDADAAAAGQPGVIGSALEAKLAAAEQLTVRSPGVILFSPGAHRFNDLLLDTAALALTPASATDAVLQIDAGDVRLLNSAATGDGCVATGLCGIGAGLTVNAETLSFGANDVRTAQFAGPVTLNATGGMFVEGAGSFDVGNSALILGTPLLADRGVIVDPRDQAVRPDYTFLTTGAVTIAAPAGAAVPTGVNGAPGARIGIGTIDAPVLSVAVTGSTISATAGIVDIRARGDIALTGATLSAPGYEKTFGDSVDAVTISAGGGVVQLVALDGNIATDAASRLITDTGIGSAGALDLRAGNGAIVLDATINPGVTGARQGSFTYDSGQSAFDLTSFAQRYGTIFGGDVAVRSGAGNLDLAAGTVYTANDFSLTADGGTITIAGTIDTSGDTIVGLTADQARNAAVDGGDIALWGRAGVALTATARLDTHTSGYADTDNRAASAGDVTIGIESETGAISIAAGAVIDAGARRTQAAQGTGDTGGRLIPVTIIDPATGNPATVYRYAEPDSGGIVRFRAPVLGIGEDKVALSQGGAIQGAADVQLEAFKRYDLDALADSGLYSGISRDASGGLLLDFAAAGSNPFTENFQLADGGSSVVRFIQNFGVTTVDGSSLAGIRLRPGVELASAGDLATATQWNLAAATFSPEQLQGAVDAGVLTPMPELGTTAYSVVPGREGDLLDGFATFLYRVGGTARGEAPVVTLRSGGDLAIGRSISDGFFTFRDKSDPAYLSYQLGGGDRSYSPAIQFSCGGVNGSCADIVGYQEGIENTPGQSQTLAISLATPALPGDLTSGAERVNSPLALAGNGAAGGGTTGDSLGFGELFPLLGGTVTMHASDIRLVAGADSLLSVDPLHVDRARAADVSVSGEYSYRVTATGTVAYDGPLQFRLLQPATAAPVSFDIDRTLDLSIETAGLDQLPDDAYTQLIWGSSSGLGSDANAAAQVYFAGSGYTFLGGSGQSTGIIAPIADVLGFLDAFEPTYQAGLASGQPGYSASRTPQLLSYGTANQAYVRSYVRTGDGSIDIAAARDIDLRGAADPVYRTATGITTGAPSGTSAQFAAAAVYTAGVRVAPVDVGARIIGGGAQATLTLDSPYLTLGTESANFIPSPKALSDTQPVLADGGGDITLAAARDILGRRDVWSETFLDTGAIYSSPTGSGISTGAGLTIGQASQRWRTGSIGVDTEVGIAPRYFSSGVGALAGGDVSIDAGRDITELTVALTNGVTTTPAAVGSTMLTIGGGDLAVSSGRDILAGRFDIASGAATIHADRDIDAFGNEPPPAATVPQYMRVRLADAVVDVTARGAATLASVSALGVDSSQPQSLNSAGFFSPSAAFHLTATDNATIAPVVRIGNNWDYGDQPTVRIGSSTPTNYVQVLPPTMELTSLSGSVVLPAAAPQLLYPSAIGQLRLLSNGDITDLSIAMSDADPSLVAGAFVQNLVLLPYQFPFVTANTTDAQLRAQHNQFQTHRNDPDPVRIYTNGDIDQAAIFLPKQGRITAGGDITDLFFNGQNLLASDVTRIRAGGDIRGSTEAGGVRPFVVSNNFILGGPGQLIVEAGGDLGPFVTSATVVSPVDGQSYTFGGGIRTVGNEYNPWLDPAGAALGVRFGMVNGADYTALRDVYLNPANLADLDGDLFVQVTDAFGNQAPDRGKPIYAPLLAIWLRENADAAFAEVFGGQTFADTDAGNAALAEASYSRQEQLYTVFAALEPLRQQDFLINDLYFNELREVGNPDGPSFQQFIRGYRAVQTLFPTRLGYTDNLAPYTVDPATVSADHPLGEPVRTIVDGQPLVAERIVTGAVDLRLATIQTARGGDITILGPGGDVIAGSVVRTADQPARRATAFRAPTPDVALPPLEAGLLVSSPSFFTSVPLGFEGVLTLRGGDVRAFTDGSFILNQSRVFTQAGGDILLWSSNGDLNAGQGPKSASNFPPVTLRFDENGSSEVNSAGSVAGAGIGAFKRAPEDPASDVILIAPVGEVDAGDAGVRASGNVVVAAARVANADNFSATGDITGVPGSAVAVTVATPNSAASALAAQAASAANANANQGERRSLISVDVLGPAGEDRCVDASRQDDPACKERPQ